MSTGRTAGTWWRSVAKRDRHRRVDAGEEAFASRALVGLMNGDLEPLVDYLRSGYELHGMIADLLADMIEGGHSGVNYRIEARPDGRAVQRRRTALRDYQIATFSYEQQGAGGSVEGAIQATMDHFGISRSKVMAARAAGLPWRRLGRLF